MAKRIEQDQLFTALILSLLTLFFTATHLLERVDHIFYDVGQVFSAKNPPKDIVIIAIDEHSLDVVGKWPWRRSVHAQMLGILQAAKPKAVGVDIFFSETDENHPQDDVALTQAFAKLNNVVLPIIIDAPHQGARLTEIHNMQALSVVPVGRVNVPLDSDGIARGIYLWEAISPKSQTVMALPHFSSVVLRVANQLPSNMIVTPTLQSDYRTASHSQVVRQDERKIRFYGPPGHFQQVSYSDVLSGEVPASFFTDKIVLVGATAVGMGDLLATPMSGLSKPMSGVEFHANAIEAIKNQQLVSTAPLWVIALFSVVLSLIPLFWLPALSPLKSLLTITVYLVSVVLLTLLLPVMVKIWVPTSAALLSILLAYPIWSWRRLERAHAFLDNELRLLSEDLEQFGVNTPNVKTISVKSPRDVLYARIEQLKKMADLLRVFQKNRDETLSFISHDIRTPIATALMLLESSESFNDQNGVLKMLSRAKTLADTFLQTSKAESMKSSDFKVLELNGLLQETVDNLYYFAHQSGVRVRIEANDAEVWLKANFGLLQRAFENIISNAIKYSFPNTVIVVSLEKAHQSAKVSISNQGEGIPANKIPLLFEKFSRLENDSLATEGSGLGLYFVNLVIRKHHGEISVKSEPNNITCFTATLPLLDE